jgi:hypothetical protein
MDLQFDNFINHAVRTSGQELNAFQAALREPEDSRLAGATVLSPRAEGPLRPDRSPTARFWTATSSDVEYACRQRRFGVLPFD